jgi:uncharacterized protein (TIGR02996 family)
LWLKNPRWARGAYSGRRAMTDDAFLADILENPDDDAPRLIFADWLDDKGDPERAEFIRLQCALASEPADHPGRAEQERREVELLEAHRATWAGALLRHADEVRFRRGFIESVRMPLGRLLANADAIFSRHPVRMLSSQVAKADDVRRLAPQPQLTRLAVLNISSSMREAAFRTLMESPHLGGLRGLAVHDSPIGTAGIQALLEASVLERLTHLDLSATAIGNDGATRLIESPKSRSLVSLNLRGNNLTGGLLQQMDASPHMASLRRLGLWYNRLRDTGLEAFLRLPLFARLRHLDIGYNHLTERGALALARSSALANLRSLWMGADRLGNHGVLAIVHSPYLHPEAQLALWFCDYLTEETKREAEETLSGRVHFDRSQGLPERDPFVGWPLWQAPDEKS